MDSVVSARDRLRKDMQEAVNKLTIAIGMDGKEKVASASFACHRDILVDIVERNIWGTRFSEIEYKRFCEALMFGDTGLFLHLPL